MHSTNSLERLNKEVKRRADVVGARRRPRTRGGRGSLPNEDAITRLIGALLFEQNDEWQSQNRYMQIEGFALIGAVQTDPLLSICSQAA